MVKTGFWQEIARIYPMNYLLFLAGQNTNVKKDLRTVSKKSFVTKVREMTKGQMSAHMNDNDWL